MVTLKKKKKKLKTQIQQIKLGSGVKKEEKKFEGEMCD